MATAGTPGAARTPGQTFALVFGAAYLLVGILGFFAASEFTGGQTDDKLIIFPVNHLHNIVHLAIGGLWVAAARRADTARQANLFIGVAYLGVALLGFLHPGDFMHTLLNIHSSGDADNWLHLASGALALYFGTAGERTATTASA